MYDIRITHLSNFKFETISARTEHLFAVDLVDLIDLTYLSKTQNNLKQRIKVFCLHATEVQYNILYNTIQRSVSENQKSMKFLINFEKSINL